MNIFYTHSSPDLCAQNLDNQRLVKMVLETAQILCTVWYSRGWHLDEGAADLLYRPTHRNHPCVKWACDPQDLYANYRWLAEHLFHLASEYTRRYDKEHKVVRTGLYDLLEHWFVPQDPNTHTIHINTDPPRCFGQFNPGPKIHTTEAYRRYMIWKWWHQRRPPVWYAKGSDQHPPWWKPMERFKDRLWGGGSKSDMEFEFDALPSKCLTEARELYKETTRWR